MHIAIKNVSIKLWYKAPQTVANFLQLANGNSYTGHSFQRSSATLLVESGGDLMTLKKYGGRKSPTAAEGYVDESVAHMTKVANKEFRTCASAEIIPDFDEYVHQNIISTPENSTIVPNSSRNM
ncbi:unnamed protein product [Psylliodes chrysocephalus]|uniref:PPIase cyclophilin-type domain-containing protein n=1 Tax=Psylliodes chrysocephalus TaxID=3402493 RepID=A0A9P0CJ26_9CUCU|nr:unnamed protein product [Psylliodes chrysocephala]